MSPVSRSRKPKKKAAKPRRQRASTFEVILGHAARLTSLLEARTWASGVLGMFRWAAWESGDSPEEMIEVAMAGLTTEASSTGGPAGIAVARAFSLVGEAEQREEFRQLAEGLALSGVPEPAWFDGYRTPDLADVYSVTDSAGDVEVIVFDYRDHLVGAVVDHLGLLNIAEVKVASSAKTDGPGFATALAKTIWPDPTPERITAGQALDRLMGPLDQLLLNGPLAHAEIFEGDEAKNAIMGAALLEPIVDSLPGEPPTAAEADVVRRFLTGDLADEDLAWTWALFVTDDAVANGRADDSFSFRYAETLLQDRLVPVYRLEESDFGALAEVVRAWADFVGVDWNDQLPTLLDEFATAYRAYDVPDERVVDFRSYRRLRGATPDTTQGLA